MRTRFQRLGFGLLVAAVGCAGLACSKGKPASPTAAPIASLSARASPSMTASPEATPTPETIGGVTVHPLTLAKADPALAGVALFLAVSGHGDGPVTALDRIYVDQGGNYQRRRLFERTLEGPRLRVGG